jgi:hypothetical protein
VIGVVISLLTVLRHMTVELVTQDTVFPLFIKGLVFVVNSHASCHLQAVYQIIIKMEPCSYETYVSKSYKYI